MQAYVSAQADDSNVVGCDAIFVNSAIPKFWFRILLPWNTILPFHFLSGFGLLITDFILLTIGGQTRQIDTSLRAGFFPLFPAYCLGRGFFVLSTRNAFSTILDTVPPLYDWDQMGAPLTFLVVEAAVTWTLTLVIQVT